MSPLIEKHLVLSNAHISWADALYLERGETPFPSATLPYGFQVFVGEEDSEFAPTLNPCLQLARQNGCVYIMFDRDVAITEGLPIYDW